MVLSFKNDQFAVFDDFLLPQEFMVVWNYFQSVDFEFIQSKKWVKVNRLLDGNPLFGPVLYSERHRSNIHGTVFPSGEGLDIVCSKIQSQAYLFESLIGKKDEDWKYFFARSYLYPAGSGLSWHDDYGNNMGAYVLYVHPSWNSQWGGELFIADPSTRNMKRTKVPVTLESAETKFVGPYLNNSDESEKLMANGIGHYIQPKPNRLIIISAGVQHMVKKVEISAGDNCRCSIAGFFIKPNKIDSRFDKE